MPLLSCDLVTLTFNLVTFKLCHVWHVQLFVMAHLLLNCFSAIKSSHVVDWKPHCVRRCGTYCVVHISNFIN